MGIVFQTNKALVRDYGEETAVIRDILIEPGREQSQVKLAALSSLESDRLLRKLDTLAMQTMDPSIATMLAEEAQAIMVLVRVVKTETKESFMGVLGSGSNLDIAWLRAQHIGSVLTRGTAAADNLGIWSQVPFAVGAETWLHTVTPNAAEIYWPTQTMREEAGVIHLGVIDPIEVPKIDSITFTIAGIPSSAQSLNLQVRKQFGTNQSPIVRFEKPVLIGPEKTQMITVFPFTAGDTRLQLLSLIVAQAQQLTVDLGA